jgi:hypothetical protein
MQREHPVRFHALILAIALILAAVVLIVLRGRLTK